MKEVVSFTLGLEVVVAELEAGDEGWDDPANLPAPGRQFAVEAYLPVDDPDAEHAPIASVAFLAAPEALAKAAADGEDEATTLRNVALDLVSSFLATACDEFVGDGEDEPEAGVAALDPAAN